MITYDARDIRAWSLLGSSGTFGLAAIELAATDPDFMVITSDLCFFSGLEKANRLYEGKVLNVGIAEQNMIGIAGGMAKEGMHVWTTTYASFATTRALDQVKVNMGYMRLPIHLIGLGAGLSTGILGATHMSIEDIAIMRAIPNIYVISPADCTEAMKAIMCSATLNEPVYIRLPSLSRVPVVYDKDYEFIIGKANSILKYQQSDIAIFSTGTMVKTACQVSNKLEEMDVLCDVYDMHTLKPLDVETIKSVSDKKLVISLEEHSVIGGLGSAILEATSNINPYPKVLVIGIRDYYPHAASYGELIEECGLDEQSVISQILKELN